jgi:hypothetical protein
MTDKPRFQLLNVKVLTCWQRWIVGVAGLSYAYLASPLPYWQVPVGNSVLRPVCHDKRADQPKRDSSAQFAAGRDGG